MEPWDGYQGQLTSIQNSIHDVLEEGFEGRVDELGVGVFGSCEEADQDAGDHGCDAHRAFTADILHVDGDAGEEGARHADGRGDGVVAVLDGDRSVAAAEILGQEGVEQRVAHSDGGPDDPEEDGGHGELAAIEEGLDAVARELAQVALDDLKGRELLADDLGVAANLVEDVFGEPGLALVEVGDSVDYGDGLGLSAAGEEELGRLEQVEEEEAADEHEEGDAADDVDEVTPALVDREVCDASPGDCDELVIVRVLLLAEYTYRARQSIGQLATRQRVGSGDCRWHPGETPGTGHRQQVGFHRLPDPHKRTGRKIRSSWVQRRRRHRRH